MSSVNSKREPTQGKSFKKPPIPDRRNMNTQKTGEGTGWQLSLDLCEGLGNMFPVALRVEEDEAMPKLSI